MNEEVRKGLQLTTEQRNLAITIIQKEAKAQDEANQVRAAALPGLKQMQLDSGNLDKQLDTFATTSMNAVTPALRDMLLGTTSLSAGFKSLGLTVVQALNDAIIKITIIKPMIDALSLSLKGTGLLNFLGGGSNATDGIGGFGPTAPQANGNAFNGGNVIPFARGGIVSNPTLFSFAGAGLMGAGPEAIMPLRRGPDVKLRNRRWWRRR